MIRKLFIAIALMLTTSCAFGQTCGILLYNNDGRKFKVYANGELQNPKPMSNIRLCCFPMDIVKVKLEFEDKQVMEKTLYLRAGFVEHHRVTDKKIVFDKYEEMPPEYAGITAVTVINVNGVDMQGGGASMSGSATVTSRSSTSSGSGCMSPMSDRSFYEFYGHLKSLSFDGDKLTEAKNAVRRDCFTSKQIKNTLAAFTYESSRLEFAKHAYGYVYDKGAYSTVKEGFSNSLSGSELEEYIGKH